MPIFKSASDTVKSSYNRKIFRKATVKRSVHNILCNSSPARGKEIVLGVLELTEVSPVLKRGQGKEEGSSMGVPEL